MPLQLPNLDDLRWKDLVAEGRSLIPSSGAEWTNHNPSDPGITLIELFAYVSEALIYQLNRISDNDTAQFLSLINGPGWKRDKGLTENAQLSSLEMRETLRTAVSVDERRRTVRTLLPLTRAVTPGDFEVLACANQYVQRAKCLPQRNLENDDPSSRWLEAPGHVSVVVLPLTGSRPSQEVLAQVRQDLEQARLLTTRVHVVRPRFVEIGVRLGIVPSRYIQREEELRKNILDKLMTFLDPHRGWFDGRGWPIGRDLHVSELYQLVGEIQGVESLTSTVDSEGASQDEITVKAAFSDRIVRDQNGFIQAITLLPDELFEAKIDPRSILFVKRV